jgi:hypothetical protein
MHAAYLIPLDLLDLKYLIKNTNYRESLYCVSECENQQMVALWITFG